LNASPSAGLTKFVSRICTHLALMRCHRRSKEIESELAIDR
jgi:hypothetical protein